MTPPTPTAPEDVFERWLAVPYWRRTMKSLVELLGKAGWAPTVAQDMALHLIAAAPALRTQRFAGQTIYYTVQTMEDLWAYKKRRWIEQRLAFGVPPGWLPHWLFTKNDRALHDALKARQAGGGSATAATVAETGLE